MLKIRTLQKFLFNDSLYKLYFLSKLIKIIFSMSKSSAIFNINILIIC